jgi:hypothetical protein
MQHDFVSTKTKKDQIINTLKKVHNLKPFSGFILSFLCGLLIITILQKEVSAKSSNLSVIDQGLLTIKADNLELKHIILEFEAQHSLRFTGFSDFMENKITLSYTGSKMDIIAKLLKLLEIQSYTYEFYGEELIHVTAVPTSPKINNSLGTVTETTKKLDTNKLNSSTVQIQKVLPDSQGEMVQLEVNDYIIAYNGHKIPNARRLIDYVKKYKLEAFVSIVIVRDERILEFTLGGGMIGVQITTIPIKFEILEDYYRDLGI